MSAPPRPRFQNRRGRPDRDGPPPHRPGAIDEAILYGAHPVIEALRNPRRRFRKLLATENALKRLTEEIGELPLVPEMVRPSQIDRLLTPDSPFLPAFEMVVTTEDRPAVRAAADAFAAAMAKVPVKYRSPRVTLRTTGGAGLSPRLDPRLGRLAIAFAGADQILAGSDYPHQIGSIPKMISSIKSLGLPAADEAKILGENAATLLGI